MAVSKIIKRIRDAVESGQFNRYGLAREAGLDKVALHNLFSENWNPRASTLMAVEKVLDAHKFPAAR